MNLGITLVIVTFIICVTIIVHKIISYYFERLKGIDNYWRGRYGTLKEIFNRAVKYDLTDDMMHDIEHIIENNQ